MWFAHGREPLIANVRQQEAQSQSREAPSRVCRSTRDCDLLKAAVRRQETFVENASMDLEAFQSAQHAMRDILFMYRFMTTYRGGLYDDFGSEDGDFDPLAYVDIGEEEDLSADDIRLLREGSAIKVICCIWQAYGQGDYPREVSSEMNRIRSALAAGRFRYLPELEAVIRLGLTSERHIAEQQGDLYEKYVRRYLQDLAASA